MEVRMLDTVETAHTIIPDLEDARIVEQAGLRILSREVSVAGGLSGECYVLLLAKEATLDLPDRLARRLKKTGHAD